MMLLSSNASTSWPLWVERCKPRNFLPKMHYPRSLKVSLRKDVMEPLDTSIHAMFIPSKLICSSLITLITLINSTLKPFRKHEKVQHVVEWMRKDRNLPPLIMDLPKRNRSNISFSKPKQLQLAYCVECTKSTTICHIYVFSKALSAHLH